VRVSNPYAGGPDEPNRVRGGLVALGVVLGVVATFIWMAVVLVVGISQENNSGGIADWVVFVLFFSRCHCRSCSWCSGAPARRRQAS